LILFQLFDSQSVVYISSLSEFRVIGVFREIWQRRELLWLLVVRNLKLRYKHSALGFFWSLLSPLLLILIYALFAAILRFNQGRPNYLEFLVTGIVVWQFLSMCLNDSLYAIMGNVNLVKKTAFPRIILPLAMVLSNLLNFLLTWIVLFAYLAFSGMKFSHLELLPLVLGAQTLLCLGLALLLSAMNVFFRDTEHILGIGTLAWFFMSPIFYPVQMQLEYLPQQYGWLAFLNPMSGVIWGDRRLLMGAGMPDVFVPLWYPLISAAVCFVVLLLGFGFFQKMQARFGDEL
jgi:ABC-2 type transport system permease protein